MNKDAIRNTAVCSWDTKEKCFIVQSPLYDALVGAARTEAEAWEIFDDFLDDAYLSYLEGRLGGMYTKRGRPAKNRTAIHCEVKSQTRKDLRRLAANLGCSQGEVIDYLTAFLRAAKSTKVSEDRDSARRQSAAYSSHSLGTVKKTTIRRKTN